MEVSSSKLKYEGNYGSQTLQQIVDIIQSNLQSSASNQTVKLPIMDELQEFEGLVDSLKQKFANAKTTSEKVQVLSATPPAWSRSKALDTFGPVGASEYLIRKTKKLVKTEGVLCSNNPRPGRPLSDETVKIVQDFYERDETSSKQMPGCRDCISVMENGVKIQKQKRMILSNLEHLRVHGRVRKLKPCRLFQICFSTPKALCVCWGCWNTHSVCVCIS